MKQIPQIIQTGGKRILFVDGKPFVAIAGEAHNSDPTSTADMKIVWDAAQRLGLNTVLLPVTWEMTEPAEGQFDFSLPRALITEARERGIKLIILWFGSWKNGECMYAPEWVKRDMKRFPRAQIVKGENRTMRQLRPNISVSYSSLSYLSEKGRAADAEAFRHLMRFLREYDGQEHTVIMVQVENETGLLGRGREVSDVADRVYAGAVPEGLIEYLKGHTSEMAADMKQAVKNAPMRGSWEAVFGSCAEEVFSAWHVASYVNEVAQAGKEEYPLPMAVNCWLDKGNKPGMYPSGGPVARVHEIWDYCAPAIDVYGPDIYVRNFVEICEAYTKNGNPLFIPECAVHSYCGPRLVYAVGHHQCICYSPFGFQDIGQPFTAMQSILFGVDVEDPALATPQNPEEFKAFADIIKNILPTIAPLFGTNDMDALISECSDKEILLGDVSIRTEFQSIYTTRMDGCLMAVRTGTEEILLCGNACVADLVSMNPDCPHLEYLSVEEGFFDENGYWQTRKRLNGDEAIHLYFGEPMLLRVRFFTFL